MEVFFFILALIVIGIVYLIDQNTDARLREAMQRAWQQRDFQEYDRLARKLNAEASRPSGEGPLNFFAALFFLDFLDHGLLIIFGILLLLAFLVWLGLQIKIAPFPPFAPASGPVETMPLPSGLPAPVERFYRQTYGEAVPLYNSVAISGTGTMSPFGLPFPMRFRLLYNRMTDYRSLITASFYGIPVMTGDESSLDGVSIGRMPTGADQGPWFDSGLNVRVWAEALNWFPAVLLTDGRARWQPLDADTALLFVPFGDKEQTIVVRFDPTTGKVAYLEAMKYRKAGDLMLWVNGVWFDQGRQWIVLNIQETLFNVDVTAAIRE